MKPTHAHHSSRHQTGKHHAHYRGQVKVLDFGLAKTVRDPGMVEPDAETGTLLSLPGMMIGTVPVYVARAVRARNWIVAATFFSFGVVLYELLSGRRPFEAKSSAEVISAILTRDPPPITRSSLGQAAARKSG